MSVYVYMQIYMYRYRYMHMCMCVYSGLTLISAMRCDLPLISGVSDL